MIPYPYVYFKAIIRMLKNLSNQSIFLIGFMGAGKTELGQHLNQVLNRPFYDTDQVIEAEMGLSVASLFNTRGESWFRNQEAQTVELLTRLASIILATGGGAILNSHNRDYLKTRGHVIYLKARIETLWDRIKDTGNTRPLLQDEHPFEKMKALLAMRAPLYEETAHTIIDTDDLTLEELGACVIHSLSSTTVETH